MIEPSNLELERQQAYVALDLQEWKQADELTDDVIARSPDDEATLRLARMRDVHKMSGSSISGTQGISLLFLKPVDCRMRRRKSLNWRK